MIIKMKTTGWIIAILIIVLLGVVGAVVLAGRQKSTDRSLTVTGTGTSQPSPTAAQPNALTIAFMQAAQYPGSALTIEQQLAPGSNYDQFIASYRSAGLKIYGLLTIPHGPKPASGWPVIIFNHGYIPPTQYRTTERYVAYVDGFARNGYLVFKPDYRGNGSSEGQPEGAYYSPADTIDVLNALETLKSFKEADPNRIGMWGHSMGGAVTLRSLVVRPNEIKAAVIWGGVVGTYDDLLNNWQRRVTYQPPPQELALRNRYRSQLLQQNGTPQTNPDFWHSIDPNFNLAVISAPIQLDVGLSDEEVPWEFSQGLADRLQGVGKVVELYTYPGADHNIAGPAFSVAMQRSLDFFNKYLK
jgi:dipeptidyl aminopeptidase/acylaminoacyl peptidase